MNADKAYLRAIGADEVIQQQTRRLEYSAPGWDINEMENDSDVN